jgi:hypothetical protein
VWIVGGVAVMVAVAMGVWLRAPAASVRASENVSGSASASGAAVVVPAVEEEQPRAVVPAPTAVLRRRKAAELRRHVVGGPDLVDGSLVNPFKR